MRILVWTETFWPLIGGIEVVCAQLVRALRDRSHELLVITADDNLNRAADNFHGIPVQRFPFWHALRGGAASVLEVRSRVAALQRQFAPDIVHVHGVNPGVFFQLRARREYAAPLIVTMHGGWSDVTHSATLVARGGGRCESLLAQTLRAADWVLGVSSAVLEETRAVMPEIADRSSVLPNGLLIPPDAPSPPPVDPPHLVCVARLAPEKGIDIALAAFPAILRKWPAARMTIAGDGPLREALQQQAAALGLADAVAFTGWSAPSGVAALLDRATVVLVPSRRESFGVVALEAALRGRPVVASRVDGLPEVVLADETGVLVEPEQPEALAGAIAALLGDPVRARRLGWAAWERARTEFALDRCVDAHEQLYRFVRKEERHARVAGTVRPQ